MHKAADAFRTISEVSQTLDVPQHVLRFWEGKFPAVKPLKRAGGRRYYRPEDIDLLRGIRALLYAEGYTVKGVQKLLREGGARHICEIGRIGLRKAGRPSAPAEPAQLVPSPAPQTDDLDDGSVADAPETFIEALQSRGQRDKLEAALRELLALRDLLRAERAAAADAA